MKFQSNCFSFSDFEKPVILNMPSNIIKHTNYGLVTAFVSWVEPYATDNSGSETLTSSHSPGSSFYIGVTPVQYTAVDPGGNTMTQIFTIHVKGKFESSRPTKSIIERTTT